MDRSFIGAEFVRKIILEQFLHKLMTTATTSSRLWMQLEPKELFSLVSNFFFCFKSKGVTNWWVSQTATIVRPFHSRAERAFSKTHIDACIYTSDSVNRLKYAYERGHQLASHTWAHKDLTTLSLDQSKELEFRLLEWVLDILTNFRYPVNNEMWGVERESVIIKSGFWN